MVIKNVKIRTMTERDYDNGYVKVTDGVFTEIGDMKDFTGDEECVDAKGTVMYPGFVDAHCHLGMFGDSLTFEGDDGNESTDPCTPNLRAIDSVNPLDRCFEDAFKAGVTAVCTGVGSANPIGGSFVVMKTFGSKRADTLVVKSPCAIKFALGENPKNVYNERDETPITRMAVAAIIREQLAKAKRYREDIEEYERFKGTDSETSKPDYDAKCEALLPLFDEKNRLKAHFHCHRADDIFTAVRIAKEFELDYVLIHCTEGALIADELSEDNPAVVLGPLFGDRGKPELRNHGISTPKALFDRKIRFAICTDHPETPIQYLPLTAALAVKGGLDELTALKAITIEAAKIIGADDRIGSIEVGKDADFSLFRENPLELNSEPCFVSVGGKIAVNKL